MNGRSGMGPSVRTGKSRQQLLSTGNCSRYGFSLIEVVLATAVLMGSVIVLARLAGMGRSTANKAELLSLAQLKCEQTLHEIVLGIRAREPVQNLPLLPVETARTGDSLADELNLNEGLSTGSASFVDKVPWLHSVLLENDDALPALQSLSLIHI